MYAIEIELVLIWNILFSIKVLIVIPQGNH